ncbi:hypothetical protein [Brucella intermedia]|uniref:hypothetical protein n=1 Tax=Brucella intermedia TaxID=94625 RepID=UPI00235F9E19|nr:hypothetical protein [Brucella intermedia]
MNATANAVAEADAHMNNVGLPTYTELLLTVEAALEAHKRLMELSAHRMDHLRTAEYAQLQERMSHCLKAL